jgi:tetratricopeptide (TPR) repeat protein
MTNICFIDQGLLLRKRGFSCRRRSVCCDTQRRARLGALPRRAGASRLVNSSIQVTAEYAQALAQANELFNLYNADVPWPWFIRGVVHLQHNRAALAAADLERALLMGFRGSEVRIFAAAALFRAGKVSDAVTYYLEVMRNEIGCVGNPLAEPNELRKLIGPYIPLWKPPGKLFQQAVCFYCARRFEDAFQALDKVVALGRDYIYAGNEDTGDHLTWEHVLWRIASYRRLKGQTPILSQSELAAVPTSDIPLSLIDLYRTNDVALEEALCQHESEIATLSDRIRFQFYRGLFWQHRTDSQLQQRALRHFEQVAKQIPDENTLDSLDDSAAFLMDVTRIMLHRTL